MGAVLCRADRDSDEQELNGELHRLAKLHLVERAGADEIAFGAHGDGFVGMTGPVLDLACVEDVDLGDFDLLVNLPLLELRVAGLIHRRRLLPGRFEIEPFHEVGQIRPDRVALQERETGEAHVVGLQLARLLKAEERRVDQRAARVENHDLLPGAHCHRREIRRGNGHASKQDGKDHPEPGGNQVVRDGCDGGEFHCAFPLWLGAGLVVGSGGGPFCAF